FEFRTPAAYWFVVKVLQRWTIEGNVGADLRVRPLSIAGLDSSFRLCSSSGSAPIQTMPCKWLGITTNSSTVTPLYVSNSRQNFSTNGPLSFNPTTPSRTSPNKDNRF